MLIFSRGWRLEICSQVWAGLVPSEAVGRVCLRLLAGNPWWSLPVDVSPPSSSSLGVLPVRLSVSKFLLKFYLFIVFVAMLGLPDPGFEPTSSGSTAMQAYSLSLSPQGSLSIILVHFKKYFDTFISKYLISLVILYLLFYELPWKFPWYKNVCGGFVAPAGFKKNSLPQRTVRRPSFFLSLALQEVATVLWTHQTVFSLWCSQTLQGYGLWCEHPARGGALGHPWDHSSHAPPGWVHHWVGTFCLLWQNPLAR